MTTLQELSTADLTAELQRREKHHERLRARREVLQAELAKLDAELGEKAPKRRRGKPAAKGAARPKNSITLNDALAAAVPVGESITPKDATAAILAAGYQTSAKNFGVQVASRLAKDERFERTGRGEYKRVK